MKYLHYLSFVFFVFFSAVLPFSTLHAQKKGQPLADSLLSELPRAKEDSNKVDLLKTIARTYMLFDPKKEFAYAEEGLHLAEKIGWKKGMANLHNDLGIMIGDTGNNTLARAHFQQSLAINGELGSKLQQINNLNNIGRSYQRESDFSHATECFFRALAIAEEIKNNDKISMVCTNITTVFYTQKNYVKATEYGEMALKYAEMAGDPDNGGKALLQLGIIKMDTKDTASAKAYMARSLKAYQELDNQPQVAGVLSNMAKLEYPDHKKAIATMLAAQEIFDKIGQASVNSIANIADLGGEYYELALQSKPPEKALLLKRSAGYLLLGADLSRETSNAQLLAEISLSLSDLATQKGDHRLALEHYKTYHAINDSLFSQDKKNEIAGLESKHNIAVKDNEIAINRLILSNQRKTQIGLIAGLLLTAIIIGVCIWENRNRKRKNTTLMILNNRLDEANKVKAKFFGILSHDLRSPVSNLIHFLHLQKHEPGLLTGEAQAVHRQRISQSAEDLLNTMEMMLLWSKEQMDHFQPHIKNVAVSDLFEYLQRFFSQTEQVAIRFSHEPGLMVSTDENYLRVIMQNLTSNAIKALHDTPGGTIEWNAWKQGNNIGLSITDNGPGISDDQAKAIYEDAIAINAKSGFGLHLIKDLARAIRYNISIHVQPGLGTTFTLTSAFPG
jgi:signal transduction histidine kinase